MGTSLVPIGNHSIEFANHSFQQIANEVLNRLNQMQFDNCSYLMECEPNCFAVNGQWQWEVRPEDEYNSLAEDKSIDFLSNNEIVFTLYAHNIHFFLPAIHYQEWLIQTDEFGIQSLQYRNEWRKFFHHIIHALGGNRVIYLADNAHYLDGYSYLEFPFPQIEAQLLNDLGHLAPSFEEAYQVNTYYIDHLDNILWYIIDYNLDFAPFLYAFMSQCLSDPMFRQHFTQSLSGLINEPSQMPDFGSGFTSESLQIDYINNHFRQNPIASFVAYHKPMEVVISLKNNQTHLTLFYLPQSLIFKFIPNQVILAQSFRHNSTHALYILSNGQSQTLYDHLGNPLDICGSHIEFINTPPSYHPILKYIIVTHLDNHIQIFDSSLNSLASHVLSYQIFSDHYCVAQTHEGKTLFSADGKICITSPFAESFYYHHPNYLNNHLHFFILQNSNNQYALYQLKESVLVNPFDWDDYKADGNFNYLFFLKNDQWHQINYLNFKITQTNNPSFPSK
jgi:hypothetical protein